MRRTVVFAAALLFAIPLYLLGQDSASKSDSGTRAQISGPHGIEITGTIRNAPSGVVAVKFSIYKEEHGGKALWQEVQNIKLDRDGRYDVLLGSGGGKGESPELFASGEAHWLGVQVQGEEEHARISLVGLAVALEKDAADILSEKSPSAVVLESSVVEKETVTSGSQTQTGAVAVSVSSAKASELSLTPAVQPLLCYSPITAWKGNYSLSGSGSAVSCIDNPDPGSCSISESSSASVNMALAIVSCSTAVWSGTDTNFTAAQNDSGTFTIVPPPDPKFCGPQFTQTVVGTAPALSRSQLHIDVSAGTYIYIPEPFENGTQTTVACDGSTTTSPTIDIALIPETNFPLTLPLPANPQDLSGVPPFSAQGPWQAVVPWTFSFTLTPVYDTDDDCNDDNGQGLGSDIGCLNQSLGEVVMIVGTGFQLHYEGSRAPGTAANSVASADASTIGGWTLSVHHAYDPNTGTLFLGDGTERNASQLGTPVSFNGNFLLTSEEGDEVYVFDGTTGHHVQTLKPLTGALKYQFAYDTAGNLITVTDGSGNVTTIQRDASEHPTAIVSPFGQTTALSLDANGFVSQVTDPAGNIAKFTNTSGGLITSITDWNGNVYNYNYDGSGRLSNDSDPAGGFTALSRTKAASGLGYTVAHSTAMGRTSSFQTTLNLPWVMNSTSTSSEQHTNIWPSGLRASTTNSLQNGQLSQSATLPNGTTSTTTLSADPRWGLQAPLPSTSLTLGSLTANSSYTRAVNLGAAGNPFSLVSQTDTETVNGRAYTSVFTASTKTYLDTTAAGRQTTQVLDSLERISSLQVGSLLPMNFAYDNQGRLSSVIQGTRVTSLAYDANGFLASVTDPLSLTTSFTHDAEGRLAISTLPDGRVIGYAYDANGNVTAVTPPGKPTHALTYTPINLPSSYIPPTISGTGATTYSYDLDRELTKITLPDGTTISYGYDSAGRLSSATTPTATLNYAYSATTGNLSSASIGNGEAIAYGYNGPLPTSTTWTGTVTGVVSRTYNNNFWITSQSVNGGNTVSLSYDNDGLLTQAGALSLTYDSNGLLTGTTLGQTQDSRTYNGYGELVSYIGSYNGNPLYSLSFSRDNSGEIVGKQETINGKSSGDDYTYDAAGRLIQVAHRTTLQPNGTAESICPVWGCTPPPVTSTGPVHSYAYDSNSNRLSDTMLLGPTVTGTYDAQDRMLRYGISSYSYAANGELVSRSVGTQTTSYQYDVLGNLIAATLPNGKAISYVIDAANRRMGKQVNGALVIGFLYDGDNIVAQLAGNNQIVSQFIYGSKSNAPDYMVQAGVTYRIFSDQLGSPRLVVNTSTGQIAQQIDYDTFGNVIKDSNPGFQPFGFAGGLYDQDAKLVHFDARDYDPSIGRWTAKDPTLFVGDDPNLYGYAFNDPLNLTDPSGLGAPSCTACNETKGSKVTKKVVKKVVRKLVNKQLPKAGLPKLPQESPLDNFEPLKSTSNPTPSPAKEYGQLNQVPSEAGKTDVPNFVDKLLNKGYGPTNKALSGGGTEGSKSQDDKKPCPEPDWIRRSRSKAAEEKEY